MTNGSSGASSGSSSGGVTVGSQMDGTVPGEGGTSSSSSSGSSSGGAEASADDTGTSSGGSSGSSSGGSSSGATNDGGTEAASGCPSGDLVCGDAGSCISATDPHNCGRCGHDCTNLPHVTGTVSCLAGDAGDECWFSSLSACAPGWADCNGNPDDGCEADLSQTSHCGSCTAVCAADGGTPVCISTGDAGTTFACVSGCSVTEPTLCSGSCVDLNSNAQNCAACGNACTPPANAQATCTSGSCGFTCNASAHLCNGTCASNTSPLTCGSSCNPCATPANATATCDGTNCGFTCNSGYHNCGGSCVPNNSVSSCGLTSCTACTPPSNSTPTCDGTSCGFNCVSGYHVCTGSSGSTCNDSTSVNSCGTACSPCTAPTNATPTCTSGSCGYNCNTGFHACGASCDDNTSINSCGSSCGTTCTAPTNGTPTCNGTSCGFTCNSGYHTCGNACADNTSVNSCGTSSCTPCAIPLNGSSTCSNGVCGISCSSGFHVCGSGTSAACADNTSPNSCGTSSCTPCPQPANSTATCSTTGSCGYTCDTGFTLCSGACVNEMTDPNNCSMCGTVCGTPRTACSGGVCSCPATTPNYCGATNTCVDFSSDKLNCGSCGHSCLGGACSAGVCQPFLISSASGYGIAIDTTSVYFTDGSGGHVYKCAQAGGCAASGITTFKSGLKSAGNMFFDPGSNQIFASDSQNNLFYAFSQTGTLNFTETGPGAYSGYYTPGAFFADSTYVYWTDNASGYGIEKALKTNGTSVSTNNSGAPSSYTLGYDPGQGNLLAGALYTSGGIAACPIAGGSCTTWSTAPLVMALSVQGSTVVFAARGSSTATPAYNDGGIFTISTTGTGLKAIVTNNPNYIVLNGSMTADATYAYWGGQDGVVHRCAIAGCSNTPGALTPSGTFYDTQSLVTDSVSIWWAGSTGVFRLAK